MAATVQMLKGDFYLVLQRKRVGWGELVGRLTSKSPSLAPDEVAIKLNIELPVTVFTRPALQATVSIPADQVPPATIDAAVLDNVREVLEQTTGLDVRVALVEGETR